MVYTKPINCITIHKTSSQYKCTENQFAVQVYRKPVYSTNVQGTDITSEWNVQGTDITITRNVHGRTLHVRGMYMDRHYM